MFGLIDNRKEYQIKKLRLKKLNETIYYFIEEVNQNELMNNTVCGVWDYI